MSTILLAEDDPSVREVARLILSQHHHRVVEAATGPDTLKVLEKETVDLILLDVMLPGMDGHTLLVKMAEDDRLKSIPVVVFTALDYARDMFQKFPQVKHFLPKPFNAFGLVDAVERHALNKKESHG